MKKKKIRLEDLKVSSFITDQTSSIKGGAPVKTAGNFCAIDPFSEKCRPSDHDYGCEASIELVCSASLARVDCIGG